MYNERREILTEVIAGRDLIGVEIGALDRPLIVRDELSVGSEILYADHLTTAELKVKYGPDSTVNTDCLVDVDVVSSTGDFRSSLEGREIDYIVASHVVEHVPNPIKWLQMLFEIIKPGGFVFLVIPDKRFTFDYLRPVTSCGQMLDAFFGDKNQPSAADVFDHHSSAVLIDGSKVWGGVFGAGDLLPLSSHKDALKFASEVNEHKTYHDVHVSIFTPASFFSIIERLISTELFMPEIIKFIDTKVNDIEFFVCMKKPEVKTASIKQNCLNSLPNLSLESLVSPYMPQVRSLADSLSKLTEAHQSFQKSYSQIEIETKKQKDEIQRLRENTNILQATLNRKSIRFVLSLLHHIFGIFSFFGNKRN